MLVCRPKYQFNMNLASRFCGSLLYYIKLSLRSHCVGYVFYCLLRGRGFCIRPIIWPERMTVKREKAILFIGI